MFYTQSSAQRRRTILLNLLLKPRTNGVAWNGNMPQGLTANESLYAFKHEKQRIENYCYCCKVGK